MKKQFLFLSLLIGTTNAFANLKMDRAWMRISDPLIMNVDTYKFSMLPLSGKVKDPEKAWSSDYWARKKGGINYRWHSPNPTGFNYVSPTKAQAMKMTQTQLSRLSPTEKWDIFIGRYDYPDKKEVASYASPSSPSWEGICDGWAGAAMNHDEPTPKTLTNPDGIKVPFGSSDIKGLLSWYYAKKYAGGYAMMGARCNGGNSDSRCVQDMNAGAFHLVLTNRLGMNGLPFIADIDRGAEVWNHIPYRFTSHVISHSRPRSTSAPRTTNVVRIRTTVSYVYLLSKNSMNTVLGTSSQRYKTRTYEYYLDMNDEGDIIGGDWISYQRPDFLWLERKVPSFGGLFSQLPMLLNDNRVSTFDLAEEM